MDFLGTPTGTVLLILVGVLPFVFYWDPCSRNRQETFGLERDQQDGLFELSRLCVDPEIQKEEYNITSWFVSRCIKRFRKDTSVRAILSYADSAHHSGIIYRACNFKYYGLSTPKKDFYFADGTKHSRGSVKGVDGEWKDRTRKHRYLMVFDKKLEVLWNEESYGII